MVSSATLNYRVGTIAAVAIAVESAATNSETSDILDMELHIWNLSRAGQSMGLGTYSVTPVAASEPSSLFLLMTTVPL